MKRKIFTALSCFLFIATYSPAQVLTQTGAEEHRPKIHFTPAAHWMNDPNGMLYYKGIYHLFFQYYPDSTVWGPMHWGHATSNDLVHWQEQPIALYPDSLGYIFSGSAVVDENNTSGFGKDGKPPLVAIFTHHDPDGEKAGRNNFQQQSIAYSLDDGNTWAKYAGNPVLQNPGITDFRDPKVMWYEPQHKWIMTLATKDRVSFYSSPNLKTWTKESEFGNNAGAHGGIWECPDLFQLEDGGKKIWVLVVSINPGGPNKGSATQYFTGDFDGKTFTSNSTKTKWMDYGTDNYAGVTWSNTGDQKIFLGWMSNWQYAMTVPTEKWRSAMTLPRTLKIKHVGKDVFVASEPVKQLSMLQSKPVVTANISVNQKMDLIKKTGAIKLPCRIQFTLQKAADFSLSIANEAGENTVIGYDKKHNSFFIDRTNSGKTNFEKGFAAKHTAPRLSNNTAITIDLVIDVSSVELFADEGLTSMTDIFFPSKPYDQIHLKSATGTFIKKLAYTSLDVKDAR